MQQKKCKYCKRELPDDYPHDECENCRTKNADNLKNTLKALGGLALSIISIAIFKKKG